MEYKELKHIHDTIEWMLDNMKLKNVDTYTLCSLGDKVKKCETSLDRALAEASENEQANKVLPIVVKTVCSCGNVIDCDNPKAGEKIYSDKPPL
jgi:hypothetical protein